jgi:hypothetical protein
MAWFYNPVLPRFSRIGLVATSRRHYSPAATMVHKFAFFLTNSHFSKNTRSANHQKARFSMACLSPKCRPILGSKKDNLACSSTRLAFALYSPMSVLGGGYAEGLHFTLWVRSRVVTYSPALSWDLMQSPATSSFCRGECVRGRWRWRSWSCSTDSLRACAK